MMAPRKRKSSKVSRGTKKVTKKRSVSAKREKRSSCNTSKYMTKKEYLREPLTTRQALSIFGGKFPEVSGRKYKYPDPSDHKGWTKLINDARRYRLREITEVERAKREGRAPRIKADYKLRHVLYFCTSNARWKKRMRWDHRRKHGLEVGDPRHVHHQDQNSMSFRKTVILTPCEHKMAHGQRCTAKVLRQEKEALRYMS